MAAAAISERNDQNPAGAVELREDVPLQGGGGGGARAGCAGPRLIATAFAALSVAVTLALLTQIYYGDYEVAPHGSVSSSVPACSAGGAQVLRAGGGALDAAVAAALCLAAAAPHRLAALDASGSLLYWDYRRAHEAAPTLAEWGAADAGADSAGRAWDEAAVRPPRLLAALAGLHAQLGRLPWPLLLQPAIDYAESVGKDDQTATIAAPGGGAAPAGGAAPGGSAAPDAASDAAVVAHVLRSVQYNTSTELCAAWRCADLLRKGPAQPLPAAGWRAYSGAAAATALRRALAQPAAPAAPPAPPAPAATEAEGAEGARAALASGLAVADPRGAYVALVTGVSPDAAGGAGGAVGGWRRDPAGPPLDLAPALIAEQRVCGSRYVIGAGSTAALAATARALAAGATPAAAVEAPRSPVGGAAEAAVNVVRQRGDALAAHADSRAGGLAARF